MSNGKLFLQSPNRLVELFPDAEKWDPVLRVIDLSEAKKSGYRVRLYANTPEQVVLCYREAVV